MAATAWIAPSAQTVAFLGDSNTWNGGYNAENSTGWTYWWAKAAGLTDCRCYARSGSTWSCTPRSRVNLTDSVGVISDTNVMYNQVKRLTDDVANGRFGTPDLIFLSAGTNDAWFLSRRPQALSPGKIPERPLEPSAQQSLTNAVASSILELRQHFPDARIVVLTPPQCVKVKPVRLKSVADIIAATAETLGATVIRLDSEGPLKRDKEMAKRTLTTDGIHTNSDGARLTAELIAAKLSLKP